MNKYQYKYDKNKNWIMKTRFFEEKQIQITEREIVYYD